MNANLDLKLPSREQIEEIKRKYPIGCYVQLVKVDDEQAPSPGTKGVVKYVDDIGTIFVNWESGGCLGVVYGVDKIVKEI